MPLRSLPLNIGVLIIVALSVSPRAFAKVTTTQFPDWLQAHIGTKDGQIASVVLQRARTLYRKKVSQGVIKNPCYFAMDATRPSVLRSGQLGRRFYIICEKEKSFRAISSGYGAGRKLKGFVNFSNGKVCAKNFSNAEGSRLTTGGGYVTAETRASFKGYFRKAGEFKPFLRSFLQFEGEGDTENARERAIGGHQAVVLRKSCRRKDPESPYADEEGYVPVGRLANYTSGRSSGCTTWSTPDSAKILAMVKEKPTTVYIYPESRDIDAVAKAVKAGKSLSRAGLYWNASCLREIRSPKFWPKEKLEPIIAQYREDRALPPGWKPTPLPICK